MGRGWAPLEDLRDSYPGQNDFGAKVRPSSLWPASWSLRGRIRPAQASDRARRCGLPAGEDPSIIVTSDGRASWQGVWNCESAWTCPTCTTARRSRAADEIASGIAALSQREGEAWAQMVTMTIRHQHDVELAAALEAIRTAWYETRHDGTWCRWWRDRVVASARAVEVTRGMHGWHPHVHLLLVLRGEPLDREHALGASGRWVGWERDMLAERWMRAVSRGPAGHNWTPSWLDGIHVSAPSNVSRETCWEIAARYVTKAGLEVSGQGKAASPTSVWRIAERAAAGSDQDRARWRELSQATRGKHAIHLDARMRAACEAVASEQREDAASSERARVRVPVQLRAALAWAERAWHPSALRVPVVLAETGGDVEAWLDAVVRAHRARDPSPLEPWRTALAMPGANDASHPGA
jgi:hypothetical protein